jgi:hypothetical protein
MNRDENEIKQSVKQGLASFLGIEVGDIEDDFSLTEDLHMKPTDLTDFIQFLAKAGYDTESIDFSQVETFTDLIDVLTQHQ